MLSDAFNNVYIAPIEMLWPGLALGLASGSRAWRAAVLAASASSNFLVETDTCHAAGIEPRAAISTSATRRTTSAHRPASTLILLSKIVD